MVKDRNYLFIEKKLEVRRERLEGRREKSENEENVATLANEATWRL